MNPKHYGSARLIETKTRGVNRLEVMFGMSTEKLLFGEGLQISLTCFADVRPGRVKARAALCRGASV